jgi:2-oxoglutarate dehydrogenase E2 component (dihydrolipoamide succinyltransferase)
MPVEVKIPSLGESISEVVLTKWHKSSGDWVEKDEPLFEIESDKITTDVPSTDAGVITVSASPGSELGIGAVVARIDTSAKKPAGAVAATTTALPTAAAKTSATNGEVDSSVRATSVARKIAEDRGIDLGAVRGTGPSGRVTKEDVLSAGTGSARAPAAAPSRAVPSSTPMPGDGRQVRREKMTKLRERIAERLLHSKQSTAMLTTFNEADMTGIMSLRAKYKEQFEKRHGVGLGIMSFFVKAACSALAKYPRINAYIDGDSIVYHDYIDLSIAVSTDKGLTVPVIRDAHRLSFAEIEIAIRDLAARARDGKLTLEELQGGTFTITNGGVFGSLMATPILNPPQSAILGMHAIKKRPVEDPENPGQIALRQMMYLALSYDHRIVDGAESVGFLVHVKQCLESPERLLLDV